MKLSLALEKWQTLVFSGPITTRLKFEHNITTPAFELIGTSQASVLESIFVQDIEAAQKGNIPIMINATTYRASSNFLTSPLSLEAVNRASIEFIVNIQKKFDSAHIPVISIASIGSLGDAYSSMNIPDVEEAKRYHEKQIRILKNTEKEPIDHEQHFL